MLNKCYLMKDGTIVLPTTTNEHISKVVLKDKKKGVSVFSTASDSKNAYLVRKLAIEAVAELEIDAVMRQVFEKQFEKDDDVQAALLNFSSNNVGNTDDD